MIWSWSSGSIGKIGANIALESWLFGFRPCSGQGQFTLCHTYLISSAPRILSMGAARMKISYIVASRVRNINLMRPWSKCWAHTTDNSVTLKKILCIVKKLAPPSTFFCIVNFHNSFSSTFQKHLLFCNLNNGQQYRSLSKLCCFCSIYEEPVGGKTDPPSPGQGLIIW